MLCVGSSSSVRGPFQTLQGCLSCSYRPCRFAPHGWSRPGPEALGCSQHSTVCRTPSCPYSTAPRPAAPDYSLSREEWDVVPIGQVRTLRLKVTQRWGRVCWGWQHVWGLLLPTHTPHFLSRGTGLRSLCAGFCTAASSPLSDVAFSKTQNEWKQILFGEFRYSLHQGCLQNQAWGLSLLLLQLQRMMRMRKGHWLAPHSWEPIPVLGTLEQCLPEARPTLSPLAPPGR